MANTQNTEPLTEAELAARIYNIRTNGDTSRRGVYDAIDEAKRQFGFGDDGTAQYWLDNADCAAGLITAREMNDRIDARSVPSIPLSYS